MSILQWTFAPENGLSTYSEVTSPAIEGVSSLRLKKASGGSGGSIIGGYTTGAGVTKGKIRSIVRSDGGGKTRFGVFGMLQGSSIVSGASAYWAYFSNDASGNIILGKGAMVNGSDPAVLDQVNNGISGGYLANTNYALELKFQRDPDSGFVLLTVSVAPTAVASPSNYDYSDLVQKIQLTDNSSPYSSALTMGVGMNSSQAGNDVSVFFDVTQGKRL